MGSVMMRVVSAARGAGGGAGAGCAGRQAAGNGGKRPAGSMAGAGEGGGSAGLLRHRRAPRTWPRRRELLLPPRESRRLYQWAR